MKNILLSLLLISANSMAATIAVIDSGVDVEHKDFTQSLWMNEAEIADNGRDDDKNGYQDDVFGWNFAEQNNMVIDRKYIGTFSKDPFTFFDIQGRQFLGQATEEDKAWLDEKRKDPAFIKEMGIFGNFVHGTHVGGITVEGNNSKILSVKLIPTEVKPFMESFSSSIKKTKSISNEDKNFRMKILKTGLKALATQQTKLMEEIFFYVGQHKADIANGSFGTSYNQVKGTIIPIAFKAIFFRDPTEAEADEVAKFFVNTSVELNTTAIASAPNTLFVFAAGNDGMNNDKFPTSPTNVVADNVISVAATYEQKFIAPFSNFGSAMVDVAAPGMLIHSQIPGDEYLKVSGTSQAAPYVANVASQIKDINPALKPVEIKKVLMGTVDFKSFLKGKVKTNGIINLNRAMFAAQMSLNGDLDTAIESSRVMVQDIEVERSKIKRMSKPVMDVFVVPMPSLFI